MIELLPCPHCGSDLIGPAEDDFGVCFILCECMESDSDEEAAEKWNRRVSEVEIIRNFQQKVLGHVGPNDSTMNWYGRFYIASRELLNEMEDEGDEDDEQTTA